MKDPEPEASDTLRSLMMHRHSCRAFLPRPVPRAVLEDILHTAQRTPTWCNTQPWKLWICGAEETRRLSQLLLKLGASGAHESYDLPAPVYSGTSLSRRRESGFSLYDALGIAREDHEARRTQMLENFRFFGARTYAILTSDAALGPYGVFDCGAYAALLIAEAKAQGVDTIAQGAVARFSPALREHFSIPEGRTILCGIAFGYEDTEHPANAFRTSRADVSDVTTWCGNVP